MNTKKPKPNCIAMAYILNSSDVLNIDKHSIERIAKRLALAHKKKLVGC